MSEISREDYIKMLKAHSECEKKKVKGIWEECNKDLCNDCDLCYAQGTWGEHIQAIDKAISEMQKVDELEKENSQLKQKLGRVEEMFRKTSEEYPSIWKWVYDVEQILKEGTE